MVDPLVLHTHQSLFRDDLPAWMELARRHPGPVLELGCGSGRVSSLLAQAGVALVGIDRDFRMLAFLQRNTSEPLRGSLQYFQADFTRFNLALRFALIIMPCNTYSTLTKAARLMVLELVRRHLLPDGIFAVQLTNPALLCSLPLDGESEVEEVFPHPVTSEPVQVSSSWQRRNLEFTVTWYYDFFSPGGNVSRSAISTTHFLADHQEYRDEFAQQGLTIHAEYGDYDFSPYREDSAAWIVTSGLSQP